MVTEIPHLNDEEAERIEGEITLNEASMALRNMKHSKSSGTDGFNTEFFKVFLSKIGVLVVRALNWGFRKGNYLALKGKELLGVFQRETNVEIW